MKRMLVVVCLAGLLGSPSSWAASARSELWLYTTVYKEFIAPIKAEFEKRNPGVDLKIFQAGSEKIQSKVEAEIIAHRVQADIVMSSDPFWSHDLDRRGLAYSRPGHANVEKNYDSAMVMMCNKSVPASQRPASFADLTRPDLKGQLQMGSPLESGTFFSTVAYLVNRYGWDYFQKLRDNDMISSGGNSTVIQKVESGEKKCGIALLENVIAAQKRGSPVDIVYPTDGAIDIPSMQVIMKGTPHPDAAGRFSDFVSSAQGQAFLLKGYMYSIRSDLPPPDGARPLSEITRGATPWTDGLIQETATKAKAIKLKFSDILLD